MPLPISRSCHGNIITISGEDEMPQSHSTRPTQGGTRITHSVGKCYNLNEDAKSWEYNNFIWCERNAST